MTRTSTTRWAAAIVAVLGYGLTTTGAAGADRALTTVSGPSPVPQQTAWGTPSTCSPAAGPSMLHNGEYQASIAVDPGRPQHVVATWLQDFGDAAVVATSADGGRTWTERVPGWDGLDPSTQSGFMACENGSAGRNSATNPHVAVGVGGTVYASTDLQSGSSTGSAAVVVSSSPDGGLTWRPVTTLASSSATDLDAVGWSGVAADPRRKGVAYALWDRADGNDAGATAAQLTGGTEYVARTADGGATWTIPDVDHSIGTPASGRIWTGGRLLVAEDGTLVDVFGDCPAGGTGGCHAGDTALRAVRSVDGGQTWSPAVEVAPPGHVNKVIDAAMSSDGRAMYAAWFDGQGAAHLARSFDGGRSFTASTVDTAGPVTMLNVAVAPDGTVGLLYDLGPTDSSSLVDVWLAVSRNAGATFTSSRLAGPADFSTLPLGSPGLGEHQGLVRTSDGFDAAITLPTGAASNPTDVFFAHVPTKS